MTRNIPRTAKAMTAIAAVVAFSTTPLLAQETAPPDPVADTPAETAPTADPLAPEPTATQEATPPAPKPKVERTRTERSTSSNSTTSRSTARRTSAAAPAAPAVTPAAEAAAPVATPAEPQPPVAAAPAAPLAEPAPTPVGTDSTIDLTSQENMLLAGATALGLLALTGAGLVAHRRKRRREDEEFAARQRMLDQIEDEPTLELGPAEEVEPSPAFVRAAPMHDPVPERKAATIPARGNWESRTDADLLFRRANPEVKPPVDAE